LKLVQDAKKRVKETNVPDVKRRVDAGEKLLLIDVREDNEWAKGHLPNAVHLGRGIIERDIEQRIPDTGAKLILYCGWGLSLRVGARKICKRWATPTSSQWTADGKAGSTPGCDGERLAGFSNQV